MVHGVNFPVCTFLDVNLLFTIVAPASAPGKHFDAAPMTATSIHQANFLKAGQS
jgi:hypothetical protein